MKKWYKSRPCKWILVALEHLVVSILLICIVWMAGFNASGDLDSFFGKTAKEYKETQAFENKLNMVMRHIIMQENYRDNVGENGQWDPERIIDAQVYHQTEKITGKDESGLSFYQGDLQKWGAEKEEGTTETIVVCEKRDGSYHYYEKEDFEKKIRNKEITFILSDSVQIQDVENWIQTEEIYGKPIKVEKEDQYYVNSWLYGTTQIKREYKTVEGKTILELINEDERWNGRLEEIEAYLVSTMESVYSREKAYQMLKESFGEGNTNLSYIIVDKVNRTVHTNKDAYRNFDNWQKNVEKLKEKDYILITPKVAEFESSFSDNASMWKQLVKEEMPDVKEYLVGISIDTTYPIQDMFYQQNKIYQQYAPSAKMVGIVGVLMFLLAAIGFVWLTYIAGESEEEGVIRLLWIDKLKLEIFLVVMGILFIVTTLFAKGLYGLVEQSFSFEYYIPELGIYSRDFQMNSVVYAGVLVVGILLSAITLITWLGIVRRFKARTLWKNTLLCSLLSLTGTVFKNLKILWKVLIVTCAVMLLHWIPIVTQSADSMVFIIPIDLFLAAWIVRQTIGRDKIKEGLLAIAEGKVDYKIPTDELWGEQKAAAEKINELGNGIEKAVDANMKNERLKAELLTNVSHDIKTPLTSIVNYVDLLKRENFEDPKVQKYIGILEEKAQRLKILTEDVVEASKASSGNLRLEKMRLSVRELIGQTMAEYEDRFAQRELKLVSKITDEPLMIYADGRRVWRILSNIFNNAAKYSLYGSRVYLELFEEGEQVVLILKNISEQELNIDAEQLQERFIRGDVARSTEGSGLGLSIARSLTELQDGIFEIHLDGDLFKVIIKFPVANSNCEYKGM